MEWRDVVEKIDKYVSENIENGMYSNEVIKANLDAEQGVGWAEDGNIESYMIEYKKTIETECENVFTISDCALDDAKIMFTEHLEKYRKNGENSKTALEYEQIIQQDIDKKNDFIRLLLYGDAEMAYPKEISGSANIAKERCFGKPLHSKEWEIFFNIQKLVLLISYLTNFKMVATQGGTKDNEEEFLQVYHSYYDQNRPANDMNELLYAALNVVKRSPHRLFASKYDEDRLLGVKTALETYNYIATTTNDNFLYWFGIKKVARPVQLEWLKRNTRKNLDKQAITELIVLLCGQTDNPAIKSCFGIDNAPKNQPQRGQFDFKFYNDLKAIGVPE